MSLRFYFPPLSVIQIHIAYKTEDDKIKLRELNFY